MNITRLLSICIISYVSVIHPSTGAETSLQGSRIAYAPNVQLTQTSDDTFPLLAPNNQIDNGNLIDRADELERGAGAPHELSTDELSKELSNPNSPLASLTFKHTYTAFDGSLPGADNQASNATLFQPVFPFPLTADGTTNFFVRPAIAYVWEQPVFNANTNRFEDVSGFSDLGYDVAIGQSYDSGLVLVGGIQGTIPLGTDVSGEQWRLGPEVVAGYIGENFFFAGFPSHQWDVAGEDSYQYSTSQLELFAGAYLPDAWTLYTDSKLSYDWVNGQATIPVNLTVRKVMKIGKVPLKLELAFDYFVKSNDQFGQDWAVTLNFNPIVPNFIYDWLN